MKKALYIFLGIIGTLIIVSGLLYWLSTPKYTIEAPSLCINSGMSVSPARINVTNLWKYRPLEFIIEVRNLKTDCEYTIKENEFIRDGYVKLNKEYYRITFNPIDVSGKNSQDIKVKIERLKLQVGFNQCQTINIQEFNRNEKGAIVFSLAYNIVILVE
jgi:hypothetical protein